MSFEFISSNIRGIIEASLSHARLQNQFSGQQSAGQESSRKTANENTAPADKYFSEPPTLEVLNQYIADAKAEDLEFSVDSQSGVHIVRLVDKRTDEIIRQFPTEELLKIKNTIRSDLQKDEDRRGILIEADV